MSARLTGWSRHWRPLPECALCQRPTRRDVFAARGGFCSDCAPVVVEFRDDTADRLDIAEWQRLVAARGAEERRKAAERDARRRARHAGR